MDEIVRQAMAKWPNVPAVYGWLALDRRGNWLLKRETIGNEALNAFISRNYMHDDAGRWFFQNGPQRVFVELDYTPFVYRVTNQVNAPLALTAHTGVAVNALHAAWIDEAGVVILDTDRGIGIVHDQDLDPLLVGAMVDANGNTFDEDTLEALLDRAEHLEPIPVWLKFRDTEARLEPIRSTDVPRHFRFDPQPRDPAATPTTT